MAPKISRKDHSKKSNGALPIFFGLFITGALLAFMFRSKVANFLMPKFFSRTSSMGEPGGEFQAFGWANYIERVSANEDTQRCCYLPDFEELSKSWCSSESKLDPLYDAVSLLSQCSDSLKGKTEEKIEDFISNDYKGKVKQSGKYPHSTFFVSELKRRNKAMVSVDKKAMEMSCKLIEKCRKTKGEKVCRKIKEAFGDCHSSR